MSNRIPVTVVTGFLGSGKTTLLNRILAPERADPEAVRRIALLVNEVGAIGIDHERVRHISDNVILLESGCVCCSVRGDLVEALRELFLSALHKEIPPFSRIVIETTGLADPAAVMHTLKYEGFLRDRYVYAGCITVADCVHGADHLRDHPQALQQAVQADAVVLSKSDLVAPEVKEALIDAIRAVNAQARMFDQQSLPRLDELLAAATVGDAIGRDAARLFSERGADLGKPAARRLLHGAVQVLTLPVLQDVSHSAFSRAMGRVHELPGVDLLRLKGLLRFRGEEGFSAVHGVHRQLYPIEQLPDAAPGRSGELRPVLVFIVSGADASGFSSRLRAILDEEGIETG
ncbi:CobW family GTP-binding protein [Pusillimonas sp.]|uniref:CobW family GTP-binding protein n=1 Tax=Pusillimonas sp. TaxID=3040095 RepID=UPI0029B45CE7|nr:CobW family GTP-binding protein [Pusillimonas sp.]MDX3894300.1 GTP-binding protein [Pusillimonas sp.]